jgi:hypothetical protein
MRHPFAWNSGARQLPVIARMLRFGNEIGKKHAKHRPGKSVLGKKLSRMANIGVD